MAVDEVTVLRALAHPTRQEILERLAVAPATSAVLARAMGSNTGVLSYHLRELAKAGLIGRDPGRSAGRSIYWRLVGDDVRFADPAVSPDPALARAAIDAILARTIRAVHRFVGRTDLPEQWHETALFSRAMLGLTPAQLGQLGEEYLDLVRRWSQVADPTAAAAHPVRMMLLAFPDGQARDEKADSDQ